MSVDITVLKKRGISSGNYKKIFSAEREKRPKRVNALIDLISERIRTGRENGLRDYRTFWAIDLAYDQPANQITPTLLQDFLTHPWKNADEAFKALSKWGLLETDAFLNVTLENGTTAKMINPPVLFKTMIPIVQAYCKARLSKIFNERNKTPLLPFNPRKMTTLDQILCEIVTDLVETISGWYGYPTTLHDAIQQMVKYGVALAFPREEWHCEKQTHLVDGKEKEVTIKEGIRYLFPHPSRMGWDLLYPLSSINSDTGCEYAFHWDIKRCGDVLENRKYWNRTKIAHGTNWMSQPYVGNYFQEVYPCQLQFPTVAPSLTESREDRVALYSRNDHDKALFTTEFYMRLVPKEWGLGLYSDSTFKKLEATYDHPVWHRFTMAGDDTVIWAEPNAYTPMWFMGYDYDPNAARNSSLALECMPAQDQVGNLVTQMLITSNQNLANVIFYDTQMVDKDDIDTLKQKGYKIIRELNFVGYDSLKTKVAGLNVDKAFHTVQLTRGDIQPLLQMVSSTLNLLERTLQVTAQETGAAASHQQSKEEVLQTAGASSNRYNYTASFVDNGIDAWERQIYTGYKAYGDADIAAQVSADIPNVEKHLEALGFKIRGSGKEKLSVSGSKNALYRLEGFARSNDGSTLTVNREQSEKLFQVVQAVSPNMEFVERIGADNILKILEFAALLGGAPRGFRLKSISGDRGKIPAEIQEAIVQAQQATLQAVEQKIAQPAAEAVAQHEQQLDEIQEAIKQFQGIFDMAKASQEQLAIKSAESAQKMQQREEEFAADQRRKEEQHQAKLTQLIEEAQVKLGVHKAESAAKIGQQKKESAAKQS